VEDVAALVRELRAEGKAEWTAAGVITAAGRVFKYAKRRMNWHGENPFAGLEKGERPVVSAAARRLIFRGTSWQRRSLPLASHAGRCSRPPR
jgi:hypothetical protein